MPMANNSPRSILKQLFGSLFPVTIYGTQEEADKWYPWTKHFFFVLQESGYFHLQATKPDTVGKYSRIQNRINWLQFFPLYWVIVTTQWANQAIAEQ